MFTLFLLDLLAFPCLFNLVKMYNLLCLSIIFKYVLIITDLKVRKKIFICQSSFLKYQYRIKTIDNMVVRQVII